jgi:hypothetical protein
MLMLTTLHFENRILFTINPSTNHQFTSFVLKYKNYNFIITSKHCVENFNNFYLCHNDKELIDGYQLNKIKFKKSNKFLELEVKTWFCTKGTDLAIKLPINNSYNFEPLDGLNIGGKAFFGQDALYAGFPKGYYMDDKHSINNKFPFPFVKKTVISMP